MTTIVAIILICLLLILIFFLFVIIVLFYGALYLRNLELSTTPMGEVLLRSFKVFYDLRYFFDKDVEDEKLEDIFQRKPKSFPKRRTLELPPHKPSSLSLTIEQPDKILLVDFVSFSKETFNSISVMIDILSAIHAADVEYLSKAIHTEVIIRRISADLFLVKVSYGSPLSFDIAGIGKAFEQLRELLKDFYYRNDLEKAKGNNEVEKQRRPTEIQVATANQKLKQTAIETVKMKVDLISKIDRLKLGDDEKSKLVHLIAEELVSLNQPWSQQQLASGDNADEGT